LKIEHTNLPGAYERSQRDFRVQIATMRISNRLCVRLDQLGRITLKPNEALGKKDFRMRIRISRKESKESTYWLRLLDTQEDPELDTERTALVQESTELMRIFGAILDQLQTWWTRGLPQGFFLV